MSYTLSFRTVISGNIAKPVDKTVSVTADGLDERDLAVPVGTDQQVLIAFTVASVKGLVISSDQNMTLETNSGTSPAQTFTLTAGQPLVWYTGCGYTNPFTVDVTAFYFTNGTAVTANVAITILKDSTPAFLL